MPNSQKRTMLTIFQTASGSWHWPSIIMATGWILTGLCLVATLRFNRSDRIAAYEKEKSSAAELRSTQETLKDAQEKANAARALAEELKLKQGPRTISDEQRVALIAELKAAPKGPVIVQSDWTDAEAKGYARQISSVLSDAGFPVVTGVTLQVLAIGAQGSFMFIKDKANPPGQAAAIQQAFNKNGIFLPADVVSSGMDKGIRDDKADWKFEPDLVVIWVGQKP
jgi:hypothetical protein